MERVDRLKHLIYLQYPLCHSCHFQFDTFQLGSRAESETMFDQWLIKTNRMLSVEDKEVF